MLEIEKVLHGTLTPDNVCSFWNHVHSLEIPRLEEACKRFIYENLSSVASSPSFLGLNRDLLQVLFGQSLPQFVNNFGLPLILVVPFVCKLRP